MKRTKRWMRWDDVLVVIGMLVILGPGLSSESPGALLWGSIGGGIMLTGLLIGGGAWWRGRSGGK